MIEFINRLTGTVMYVSEERAAEYRAAGHKPATRDPPAAPVKKTRTARKGKGEVST